MLQGANFQNRSFIVMYATGLCIAHVDFTIFGVVGGKRVVEDVNRAEEVAFAIFEVVGGVNAEGVDGARGVVGVKVREVGSTEEEITIV